MVSANTKFQTLLCYGVTVYCIGNFIPGTYIENPFLCG